MIEEIENIDEDTLNIFVPITIKKRGGSAMLILPKNARSEDQKIYFDEKLIQAIGKAHKYKTQIEEGKYISLADLSRKENINSSFLSKIFSLNSLSPKIVKAILNGTQPRDLKLTDLMLGDIPLLWEEQEEKFLTPYSQAQLRN